MKFEGPITVATAVKRIETNRYLLPGIQRSFVWKRDQITQLWDSLLRGYPIGSILVWRTNPGSSRNLGFRQFVTQARGARPSDVQANPSKAVVETVLDGQQRLTALNIGLRGSLATAAALSPDRYLWIDLVRVAEDAGSEKNMYELSFMTEDETVASDGCWFPLWAVYGLRSDSDVKPALASRGYSQKGVTLQTLRRLVEVVHGEATVPVAIETSRDLDRVLNVFARTNNGGTKLTYVDLLVSTATARWEHRDARREILGLQQLVSSESGIRFSAERFVKAGLLMVGEGEPKLNIDAILKGRMEKALENDWDRIARAIQVAARTLASFGLSDRTLAAENVLIPVAYYAWSRRLPPSYDHAGAHAGDRRLVGAFVARTLLQRGYWTGAVDPILTACRTVIRKDGAGKFPLDGIAAALDKLPGKSIDVDSGFLDDLAQLSYGDRRTLLLLRLLFPDVPEKERLQKDHVFPISRFTEGHFRRSGVELAKLDSWYVWANQLPNLQLLDRADNQSKGARLPREWIGQLNISVRRKYTQQNLELQRLPHNFADFERFWDDRHSRLRERIRSLLAVKHD